MPTVPADVRISASHVSPVVVRTSFEFFFAETCTYTLLTCAPLHTCTLCVYNLSVYTVYYYREWSLLAQKASFICHGGFSLPFLPLTALVHTCK